MQKRGYSTGYQMHEQRGTFNGIDTCNITSYCNFNFRSELLSDAELRSILNGPDRNALLTQMVEEGSMLTCIANKKKLYAISKYEDFDFEPYYVGVMYVPLEAGISMQRDITNSTVTVFNNDNANAPPVRWMYRKCWPAKLYPCQSMNM